MEGKNMRFSIHAKKRMQERNISQDIVNLVLQEGEVLQQKSNRYMLNKQHIQTLRKRKTYPTGLLDKAEKCAPIGVVCNAACIITVFRIS
jgi:hypothetical protein